MLTAFVLGFVLAFLGSVPMTGPLALLVLDRILAAQRASAFWIAFAGSLVEAVVAAFVAILLPRFLVHSDAVVRWTRQSGAVLIFGIGVMLMARPEVLAAIKTDRRQHSLVAGFLTTALNPTLFATWTVTVTALHASGAFDPGRDPGVAFGGGVGTGALAWFVLLIALARRFRLERLTKYRRELGRGLGVVLALLGAFLFFRDVSA